VGTSVLEGHSKAVTSVNFSRDNSSLISASADGTVRVWNVWTRQCLREYAPLNKHGITNAMVSRPRSCPLIESHLSHTTCHTVHNAVTDDPRA
jgi:WD40 repeat protein